MGESQRTPHQVGTAQVVPDEVATDQVVNRLRRIDELRTDGATSDLLAELRALVPEAEAWARAEGDARARAAAAKLREEAEGMR
jgi:hypothetical protein